MSGFLLRRYREGSRATAGPPGSVQGRSRAGASKRQPGGRFPPSPLREAPGCVSALEQQFAFSLLSPPRSSICLSNPAGPLSPRGLVWMGLPWGEAVGAWQLPSPGMADAKANRVCHCCPGWAVGGFCGGTCRGDAGLGRQRGPWAGKGRSCEQADSSPSSCLGRGWLCPGSIWPGGAEGFLQLPALLTGLAGNMSPPHPGSGRLILTESSWHHCYNSRTRFSDFCWPIPPCCPKITPREQLKGFPAGSLPGSSPLPCLGTWPLSQGLLPMEVERAGRRKPLAFMGIMGC